MTAPAAPTAPAPTPPAPSATGSRLLPHSAPHAARTPHARPRRAPWRPHAATLALLLALVAVFGPALTPHHPDRPLDLLALRLAPPSPAHPLGTDAYARDLLSRLLHGARPSLALALAAALGATALGAAWGATAALARPAVGRLLLALADAALATPRALVLLCAAAGTGRLHGLWLAVALILVGWMAPARVVHARVTALRAGGFVPAAVALGAGPARVARVHLLPHLAGTLGALASLAFAEALAAEAALGTLGLGAPPPAATWGTMLHHGLPHLLDAPWTAAAPAAAIVTASLVAARLGARLAEHHPEAFHSERGAPAKAPRSRPARSAA